MGVFKVVATLWSILTIAIALPNDVHSLVPRQSYHNVTTPKVLIISMVNYTNSRLRAKNDFIST